MAVGILGIGTYLPPTVRTNDWWPPDIVAGWTDRMTHRATLGDSAAADPDGEGVRRTRAAMAAYAGDPFRGAVERRVMDETSTVPDMEAAAARQAIERAGVALDQIDAILVQTNVAEQLFVNNACVTHRLLGLPQRCLALATESACNAFSHHLELGRALIASGQARNVLSIHSSAMTRIVRRTEPDSAWWGDGAAAVVIGPVSEGRGVLGAVHHSDGSSCNALVMGVPGRRWWQDGAITLVVGDRDHTRAMLFHLVDRARTAIAASLAASQLAPGDVAFYASHQGTVWLTPTTADYAGLGHARTVVTFPVLGNLNSANIPFVLAAGERDGLLHDGANVVMFSGGIGETWSSTCLRWGR